MNSKFKKIITYALFIAMIISNFNLPILANTETQEITNEETTGEETQWSDAEVNDEQKSEEAVKDEVTEEEKEVLEQQEPENIALHKTVTSSEIEKDSIPENAVDGDKSTYWASKNPSWIKVDLEAHYLISKINVFAFFNAPSEVDRAYEYKVYASSDDSDYKMIAEKTGADNLETEQGQDFIFEQPISARYIKIEISKTNAVGQPSNNTGHIKEITVNGEYDPDYEIPEVRENLALNKPITSASNESGHDASKANDGNSSTFWAGVLPNYVQVDLEDYYDIDTIKVTPYYSENRFYHYNISVSADGFEFTKIAEKNDDKPQTSDGDVYTFDVPKTARFVRVEFTHNSANTSGHLCELEVNGEINEEFVPPKEDNTGNIAMNKPVRSYSNDKTHVASNINDGDKTTAWTAFYYPSYVDIDLEENYDLNKILVLPSIASKDVYYQYSIYTSTDGVNFDYLLSKDNKDKVKAEGDVYDQLSREARIVRVYLEYCSQGNTGTIQEVKVYGDKTNTEIQEAPKDLNIPPFEETEYSAPITENETLQEVKNVVSRTIGSQYLDWFEFVLEPNSQNDNDYYEISNHNGKIQIKGNEGLSITTGFNYYLKYYCNVNISQQAKNVEMPKDVIAVDKTIRKESPYQVRYAYNYCTHSYTMAFWGQEEWQNELDYLALNGFNAILDITGQEEVWRRFLMDLGYSLEETKDWLVGPGYYGWQYMANMENVNGPINNDWFVQRTELARSNQRKMRALGMKPILQGYGGMVPNSIQEKDSSAEIIPQGLWNGMQRPAMLKTNTETFDKYSEMFYQAQKEVYGDVSNMYATDPFHEGGQTGGIGRDIVGREVLDAMKAFDSDAVWVIQSWSFQPELLQNITAEEKQNNILLLDLNGTKGPKYSSTNEFAGSDWVYCMLENYGGRSGLAGNLEKYTKIPSQVKDKTSHMVGMGIAPEGTNNNPAKYDLFLEMMWETEDIDLNTWISHYIDRRYGKDAENVKKAWEVLLKTVYKNSSSYADPPESIINARPQFGITKAAPNGNTSRNYNTKEFEKALDYMMKDYDKLKDNATYLYDLTDIFRQCVANSAQVIYDDFTQAFNNGNREVFNEQSQKFLDLVAFQDKVLSTNTNFMVGTWLQPSLKAANAEGIDDFTSKIYKLNGKAIISTWAPYYCWGVYDYANREYAGLTEDYYLVRWTEWINRLSAYLDGNSSVNYKEITTSEAHEIAWEWARSDKEYPTVPDENIKNLYSIFKENYSIQDEERNDTKLVPYDEMSIRTDMEEYSSDYSIENAIDGNYSTMWSTAYHPEQPYEIFIEFNKPEFINKFVITPRDYTNNKAGNGDILGIKLSASEDGKTYDLISEKSFDDNGKQRVVEFEPIKTKYIKLEITDFKIWNDNQDIESITAAEFEFYRPYDTLTSDVYEISDDEIKGVKENTKVSELISNLNYSKETKVEVYRNDKQLENDEIIAQGDTVKYFYQDTLVSSYVIGKIEKPSDFTKLNELIAECEKLSEENFTEKSWKVFSDALTIAIGVQVNPEATQEEIDEAYDGLLAAKNALVKIDQEAPKYELSYSTVKPTNQDVTVTLNTSEAITELDGWKKISDTEYSKVYSENVEEEFIIRDLADNETKVKISITNIDKENPIIQLKTKDIVAEKGELTHFDPLEYVEKVTDNGQDISDRLQVNSSSKIDVNKEGVYIITYYVSDEAGNETSEILTLTINPKMEIVNNIPTINAKNIIVQKGTSNVDFLKGVTATDKEDGDLTSNIEISYQNVDINKVGIYHIVYIVKDSKNAVCTKTVSVEIVDKTELKSLIDKAESIDKADYTAESIKLLHDVIEEAKLVVLDENASQKEINAAVADLNTAIAKLESAKESDNVTNVIENNDNDSNDDADTGVNSYLYIALIGLISSIGVVIYLKHKNKHVMK